MSSRTLPSHDDPKSTGLLKLLSPYGYYSYLEVRKPSPSSPDEDVDKDSVERNYKRLYQKHHPERPSGDAETFRVLKRARTVLLTSKLRQQYNLLGLDLDDEEQGAAVPDSPTTETTPNAKDSPHTQAGAEGVFSVLAGDVIGSIVQEMIRTAVMATTASWVVNHRVPLYTSVACLCSVAARVNAVSNSNPRPGSKFDTFTPLLIAFGLVLMYRGRLLDVDENDSSGWTRTFWAGEALVMATLTSNSVAGQQSPTLLLTTLGVSGGFTFWLRGDLWRYVMVLQLEGVAILACAVVFPILEHILEHVMGARLKKMESIITTQTARPPMEVALELFENLDTDCNGTLSFLDLGKIWKELILNVTREISLTGDAYSIESASRRNSPTELMSTTSVAKGATRIAPGDGKAYLDPYEAAMRQGDDDDLHTMATQTTTSSMSTTPRSGTLAAKTFDGRSMTPGYINVRKGLTRGNRRGSKSRAAAAAAAAARAMSTPRDTGESDTTSDEETEEEAEEAPRPVWSQNAMEALLRGEASSDEFCPAPPPAALAQQLPTSRYTGESPSKPLLDESIGDFVTYMESKQLESLPPPPKVPTTSLRTKMEEDKPTHISAPAILSERINVSGAMKNPKNVRTQSFNASTSITDVSGYMGDASEHIVGFATRRTFRGPRRASSRGKNGERLVVVPRFMLKSLPTEDDALEMFDELDEDMSESLSYHDISMSWKSLFRRLKHRVPVKKACQVADVEGDGEVSREQFEVLLRFCVYYNNAWNSFSKSSNNKHASKLKRREWSKVAKTFGIVGDIDKVFDQMDPSGKGSVDYEDFCQWLARNSCEWEMDWAC